PPAAGLKAGPQPLSLVRPSGRRRCPREPSIFIRPGQPLSLVRPSGRRQYLLQARRGLLGREPVFGPAFRPAAVPVKGGGSRQSERQVGSGRPRQPSLSCSSIHLTRPKGWAERISARGNAVW